MYEYRAEVERIVDADTVDLRVDLGFKVYQRMRVRLEGIDAPERFTPEGKVATAWLTEKIPPGTHITIKTNKDKSGKYGRYLATLVLEGEDLNKALVDSGNAVPYGK